MVLLVLILSLLSQFHVRDGSWNTCRRAGICRGPSSSLVASKDLQASDVRVFAVLVILRDPHLDQVGSQHGLLLLLVLVAVGRATATAHPREIDVDPALGLLKGKLDELLQIVVRCAGQEGKFGGGVGFVEGEVEVEPDVGDGDKTGEMDVEQVRLRPIAPDTVRLLPC